MVYDLIYNQLITIFNVSDGGWLLTAVQIVSFTLTVLFMLIFMLIPIFALYKIMTLFGTLDRDNDGGRNYGRRNKKR